MRDVNGTTGAKSQQPKANSQKLISIRLSLRHFFFSAIASILPSLFLVCFAQDRCGTVEYGKALYDNHTLHKVDFEKWLSGKILTRRSSRTARQQAVPYKIPVVVHIIHNGESIGDGANISDAQVLSQLQVLNEDFQRRNADTVNTPAVFKDVAGSLDVEFVLAKQDDQGQATTGIVRVNGGRTSWSMNDNYTLKELSYWPAEQYLNIWVCNLTSHLGYAQFPESDLPGLENSSTNRLTDGIVIWYRAFGSINGGAFNLDPRFDLGRTATHETGHFFGLNHIWADDPDCDNSDYVNDTPNQADQTDGCPSHPQSDMCSDVIMFQNFLDYSDDACMNLFTEGQIARMVTVIENSPRRATLLTSPGLEEPAPVPNDLGIRTIVFPDASVCSNLITPVIEVRNYGSNPVTSARVRFVVDGTTEETRDVTLNLGSFESAQVAFTPLSIPSGNHAIEFHILLTNGGADGGSYNDQKVSNVIIPTFGTIPFSENFSTSPEGWIVDNPDGQITWTIADVPDEMSVNKALKLAYYDYEDKIGEIDMFLSPVLDFRNVPAVTLTFDVAHARYQSSNDRLQLVVLTDCQSYTEGTIVYNKAGSALQTAPASTSPFTPATDDQWRRELVDLSPFIGEEKVQLAFVGINDWGNNIYLDNLNLFTDRRRDIAVSRLVSPALVTCTDEVRPLISIQNAGNIALDAVDVHYSLNGETFEPVTVSDVVLGERQVELPAITLAEGYNTLSVSLTDPSGEIDINPNNNDKNFIIVVNKNEDRIPLRQNFEEPFVPAWTVANPDGGMNWEIIGTNFGQSLYFNASNNDLPGDEAWLVTPVLDFSRASEASMLFDLSYGDTGVPGQSLTILTSTDCGLTYKPISYNFPVPHTLDENFLPRDADDWHTNVPVNLNTLAGMKDVRIAFVIRNQNGSNIFLDNIEFFVTADPVAIEINELYSIYGYDLSNPQLSELRITFNLDERQDVRYSIISATGQMETDGMITDVLNQTFPLNLSARITPGVYFIRLQIGEEFYTSKILVF